MHFDSDTVGLHYDFIQVALKI